MHAERSALDVLETERAATHCAAGSAAGRPVDGDVDELRPGAEDVDVVHRGGREVRDGGARLQTPRDFVHADAMSLDRTQPSPGVSADVCAGGDPDEPAGSEVAPKAAIVHRIELVRPPEDRDELVRG